jgi:hypothetical protein
MQAECSLVIFMLCNINIQTKLKKSQAWLINIVRLLADITENLGLNHAEIILRATASRLALPLTSLSPTKHRYSFLGTIAKTRCVPRIFDWGAGDPVAI